MIKLELDEYNPSVLRHIGHALVFIAEDRESERGREVAECTLGGRPEVYGLQPAINDAPIVGQLAAAAFQAPPPPAAEIVTLSPGDTIPLAGVESAVYVGNDDDDGFPNPPGTNIPAPPTATELDSAGIPWDARIHAATKTKCKDGSWKNKPGVDPALLASVTAELKGVQAIPVPPAPAATVPPAPPAATAGPTTFAELMKELTPLLVPGGKLTAQQVNEACQVHGLPNCGALAARPDLIPAVWSQICLILG